MRYTNTRLLYLLFTSDVRNDDNSSSAKPMQTRTLMIPKYKTTSLTSFAFRYV